MEKKITICHATSADIETLAQLAIDFRNHNQKQEPNDQAFRLGVSKLLSSTDAVFLIAFCNNQACGYTLLRFRFSMWANGIDATLEDLYVDGSFRQLGIGKQLVDAALNILKQQQVISVHVDTNENNPASNTIYTQCGFSCINKRWNGKQLFYRKTL